MSYLLPLRRRVARIICPELSIPGDLDAFSVLGAPQDHMQAESLVKLAEIFAEQMGLRLSTVSTYAANDGKWIDSLKGGASCTLRKASDVLAWFSANWPDDLEWPRDIPRPKPKPKEAA